MLTVLKAIINKAMIFGQIGVLFILFSYS